MGIGIGGEEVKMTVKDLIKHLIDAYELDEVCNLFPQGLKAGIFINIPFNKEELDLIKEALQMIMKEEAPKPSIPGNKYSKCFDVMGKIIDSAKLLEPQEKK